MSNYFYDNKTLYCLKKCLINFDDNKQHRKMKRYVIIHNMFCLAYESSLGVKLCNILIQGLD